MYRLSTERTEKTNRRKRKHGFFETDNQACTGRYNQAFPAAYAAALLHMQQRQPAAFWPVERV